MTRTGLIRAGLTCAIASAIVMVAMPADARSRSDTGRRGISGAVEFSPVDRLGPTLQPDNRLTPNSGWNGSSAISNVSGPDYNTSTPLIAPPPPPPPRRGYIILNNGN